MKKGPAYGKRDYTPVSWDHYFERVEDVQVDANVSFCSAYYTVNQCCVVNNCILTANTVLQ